VSSEIDLQKLKINLFGNNDRGEPTSLRQQIIEFHRAEDREIVISPAVTPDEESTYAKLDLYYNKKLIDTRAVGIVTPVDSEITFQYDIYDITKLKNEIKSLFEEAEKEQNAFSRGIKFEQVIMKVVSLVPDLKVSDHNVNDKIEEIDIQVRNHNRKYIWADFDDVFFIECKYRSKRVEAKDIRDFIGKMEKNRRKVGILVSVSGVTGTEEMKGARGEIKTTFMQRGTHVIILDKNDLEEIFQCRDISEIVDKRYTDVFKWKFMSEDETNQAALSVADEISKLVRLKEQGHLTEEEFSLMKSNLINKM
jgi:Restriction endonuclease